MPHPQARHWQQRRQSARPGTYSHVHWRLACTETAACSGVVRIAEGMKSCSDGLYYFRQARPCLPGTGMDWHGAA